MAVESKIRELLRGQPEVVTEEVNELDEGSASRPADKTEGLEGKINGVITNFNNVTCFITHLTTIIRLFAVSSIMGSSV